MQHSCHLVAPNINLKPTVALDFIFIVDEKEEECTSFSGNSERTDCLEHLRRDERTIKCIVSRMGVRGQNSSVLGCGLTRN